MVPYKGLPLCLFPTDKGPRPPLIHYGWLLPQSVQDGILQRAEANNDLCYATFHFPQASNNELHATQIINKQMSMEFFVHDMIEALKLNITVDQLINWVFINTEPGSDLCLAVYSNHVRGKLPTDKEIATLAEHLGLTEVTPYWYPSAVDFQWE